MLGAIIGDMAGSIHEWSPCKDKTYLQSLPLLGEGVFFTDDTVMTIAVANALFFGDAAFIGAKDCEDWNDQAFLVDLASRRRDPDIVAQATIVLMRRFGIEYPGRGYGGNFAEWLWDYELGPYNSYGNGSAMRVSPVAWFFESLPEVERYAEVTAAVTHNHPEGIKGAQATAAAIFLARTGSSKQEIRSYIEKTYGYDLNRIVDDIRPGYSFDVSCQVSVPEAIIAFLDSSSFEDAVINAISLGGDSDTQAAIAGSIAEAFFGVPLELAERTLELLDDDIRTFLQIWNQGVRGDTGV
jgi:ADP-ribosylglycohydrolase